MKNWFAAIQNDEDDENSWRMLKQKMLPTVKIQMYPKKSTLDELQNRGWHLCKEMPLVSLSHQKNIDKSTSANHKQIYRSEQATESNIRANTKPK